MRETQHHSLAKASATARLLTALPAAVAAQAPATPMTPSPHSRHWLGIQATPLESTSLSGKRLIAGARDI